MSRSERRQEERSCQKYEKQFAKVTPQQAMILDKVTDAKADALVKIQVDKINIIMERCIEANLILNDFEDIEGFENELADLITEDAKFIENNKGDIMKEITIEMRNKIIEYVGLEKKKKEIIEALTFDFPSCSKAILTTSYQTIINEIKKENEELDSKIEKIFEEVEEVKEEIKETKMRGTLVPILVGGWFGVYRFNPEGVINETTVNGITEEYIQEQTEVFEIWKANYQA